MRHIRMKRGQGQCSSPMCTPSQDSAPERMFSVTETLGKSVISRYGSLTISEVKDVLHLSSRGINALLSLVKGGEITYSVPFTGDDSTSTTPHYEASIMRIKREV